MTFLWPEMLVLLLVAPALVALYVVLLRRRAKDALRYASLATIKEALGVSQRMRRHLPPLLLLAALTFMLIAVARPMAALPLPSHRGTVILAIDVSASMRAEDVSPSRIGAARAAVRSFLAERPLTTRIGIVSFAAAASLVQPPTSSREEILSALDGLQLQGGTAVGSGILASLNAIFPDIRLDSRGHTARPNQAAFEASRGVSLDADPNADKPAPEPVAPGSYGSAVIILLTDGKSTTGPDAIEAARIAAERGVRVYTVGIGTPNGEIIVGQGWSMRVRLDEESLKQIASETRGEYFYADNAVDLTKIYSTLNSKLTLEKQRTEISALFAALGAVFALLSAALSLYWFNRLR
jgi:Ca-activated chloride channel family protein